MVQAGRTRLPDEFLAAIFEVVCGAGHQNWTNADSETGEREGEGERQGEGDVLAWFLHVLTYSQATSEVIARQCNTHFAITAMQFRMFLN